MIVPPSLYIAFNVLVAKSHKKILLVPFHFKLFISLYRISLEFHGNFCNQENLNIWKMKLKTPQETVGLVEKVFNHHLILRLLPRKFLLKNSKSRIFMKGETDDSQRKFFLSFRASDERFKILIVHNQRRSCSKLSKATKFSL